MRLRWMVFLFFVGQMIWSQQKKEVVHLWPKEVPHETHAKSLPIQTPDTSRGVIRITNITNPTLSVFHPEESIRNGAAVIISPGGGYQYLAINIEGSEIAEWFNSLGYMAFVLEYRTPDNRLGALSDIKRAIRTIRFRANEYDLDPNKIGVIGFSAGGNLSLLASTNYELEVYEKQDEIDIISARPDFGVLLYPYFPKNDEKALGVTKAAFHKDEPPMFLFGTMDDFLVDGFFEIAKSIKEEGTPFQMHLYETGGHGYGLRQGNPAAETWPNLVKIWLAQVLNH